MSKVLVTGGSGFVGQAVIKNLLEKGFEVNALDIYEINIPGTNFIQGSVLSFDDINKAIAGCEYVVHLAAVLGVSKSTYMPMECLDVNIMGTRNILKACVDNKVKKIIFSSSSEVYGEPQKIPISEDDPLQPKSEYGHSKVVGEEYVKACKKQYGLDYTIVRFFNVYGPDQANPWVMSKFTNNAVLGRKLNIFGDGNQVRAFCHVDDSAEGLVQGITNPKSDNQIYNIGNSKEQISMKDLAQKIVDIVDRPDLLSFIPMEDSDRTAEREIYKRVPDTSKAKELLGFEAKITLDQGLKEIITYKQEHIEEIEDQVRRTEEFEASLKK